MSTTQDLENAAAACLYEIERTIGIYVRELNELTRTPPPELAACPEGAPIGRRVSWIVERLDALRRAQAAFNDKPFRFV